MTWSRLSGGAGDLRDRAQARRLGHERSAPVTRLRRGVPRAVQPHARADARHSARFEHG